MPNYSNTIIYKFCCNDANITDIYIGHTTNFTRRKYEHKNKTINENSKEYNYNFYKTIRENGGLDNWTMIEIEKHACNDANEARARERYWIELLKPSLNNEIPNRTNLEWRQDNKEVLAEKNKEYREKNKEVIAEKKKEYRENNKEKIAERGKKWYENNREKVLERVKEYAEKNKEVIAERNKEWREKNKEIISKERSVKICCDVCNAMISKRNISRHKREQHKDI